LASDKGSAEHNTVSTEFAARSMPCASVQPVAAHAQPDRRLQPLNEFELHRRWRRRAGTRPIRRDAGARGRPRHQMADRVDAERKRHMGRVARPASGAFIDPRKARERVVDIGETARIKQRRAGRAAGTPIFGNAVVRLQAESIVELAIRQTAQHVLVEDRNLAPFLRPVEPVRVDVIQFTLVKRSPARLRDRMPLARPLDLLNVSVRFRQGQGHEDRSVYLSQETQRMTRPMLINLAPTC
jgi:hypothetical protein